MTKVLHLITSLNRGGIETWLLSMLREIPRSKCAMDFCCKGPDVGILATEAEQLGAKVLHCQLGINHVSFAHRLKDILLEGQYDILHNHLHTYSGVPTWVARDLKIPVITSFHNTHFPPETRLARLPLLRQLRSVYSVININYALRYSNLVTGCSQGVIDSLDPHGIKLQKRSRVLYYGVNIPTLSTSEERASFRKSFGWSADTPLVLHVGRLIEQKNHLGLLSIFQMVLEHIPTARLLLVGEGPLRPLIEDKIAKAGLSHAVCLLGIRDDVPELMSKCNVFLFPSFYEGFGIVILEASAADLPIVASNIPGLNETVKDGQTGIMHDVNNIGGMAASVVKFIKDRQDARQVGNAGRLWIQKDFSLQASSKQLLDVYHEVITNK
ncbi:MAG: glycosyltransferase [Crinalium sp.]